PQPMSQDYRRMLEGPQPVWLLALDGREAGVLVLRRDPDALLIYSVAIDPPCQGQGLGRALLAWAEQEARRAGYDKIRLYTNALMVENMALYIHLGYRETSREAYLGSTLVHFCKELGS
ncbi:MAG TPA: GNAT family N-acetyltransferase, partial [Herpetosiphonaceae bacterium]|nr:GNAT family N-acetyltransferase [Herpetosiphonaceae bacterium]